METTYTVLLSDDTVGEIFVSNAEDLIGQEVTVTLNDENGNRIKRSGNLVEILD